MAMVERGRVMDIDSHASLAQARQRCEAINSKMQEVTERYRSFERVLQRVEQLKFRYSSSSTSMLPPVKEELGSHTTALPPGSSRHSPFEPNEPFHAYVPEQRFGKMVAIVDEHSTYERAGVPARAAINDEPTGALKPVGPGVQSSQYEAVEKCIQEDDDMRSPGSDDGYSYLLRTMGSHLEGFFSEHRMRAPLFASSPEVQDSVRRVNVWLETAIVWPHPEAPTSSIAEWDRARGWDPVTAPIPGFGFNGSSPASLSTPGTSFSQYSQYSRRVSPGSTGMRTSSSSPSPQAMLVHHGSDTPNSLLVGAGSSAMATTPASTPAVAGDTPLSAMSSGKGPKPSESAPTAPVPWSPSQMYIPEARDLRMRSNPSPFQQQL
eukprot:jgi/Chlat1/6879/Chrsp51S06550